MAEGQIKGIINTWNFDALGTTYVASLSEIDVSEICAIFIHKTGVNDKIITVPIGERTGIIDVANAKTYNPVDLTKNVTSGVRVSGNIYAVAALTGPSYNIGVIQTYNVDELGTVTFIAKAEMTLPYVGDATQPIMTRIASNMFLVFFNPLVFLATVSISDDGTIITGPIDTIVAVNGRRATILPVSGNIYAIYYMDSVTLGACLSTYEVLANGTIVGLVDTAVISTLPAGPFIRSNYGNIFILSHRTGPFSAVSTIEIQDDGTIGSIIDTYTFSGILIGPPILDSVSNTYYALASAGTLSDGYVKVIKIEADGTIVGEVDSLHFPAGEIFLVPGFVRVGNDYFGITYTDALSNGYVAIVEIETARVSKAVVDSGLFGEFVDAHSVYPPKSYDLFGLNFDESVLLNGNFDIWDAEIPLSWIVTGTVEKDYTIFKFGISSLKLTGTPNGSVVQALLSPTQFRNRDTTLQCWVKSSTMNTARICISDTNGNSYSDYHNGNGEWQLLEVRRSVATPVSIQVKLLVESGAIAYFEDASLCIWNFDEGYYFDDDSQRIVSIEGLATLEPSNFRYAALESREIIIECEMSLIADYAKWIDLLELVPQKFRESILLQEFLQAIGVSVGTWLGKIDDLLTILDPYKVGEAYIDYLAALLGLTLVKHEETTIIDLRKQVQEVVDWYKIKGTYKSLQIIAHSHGFTTNIYDMYTKDYITFVLEEWFVGDEGENPPGLDASYYKSPHFGYEVVLDKVYYDGSDAYLFSSDMETDAIYFVESIRPVNTVPHYRVLLNCLTYQDGLVYTTDVLVKTITTGNWVWAQLNFDMDYVGSGLGWNFDDGSFFDQSFAGFLNSITKYQLGIGNKGVSPDDSNFNLANVVIQGNINSIAIYDDRVEYEIIIPSGTVQDGLSELGLFLNDNTTMVVASTFPDVDKTSGYELRVLVIIMLSSQMAESVIVS